VQLAMLISSPQPLAHCGDVCVGLLDDPDRVVLIRDRIETGSPTATQPIGTTVNSGMSPQMHDTIDTNLGAVPNFRTIENRYSSGDEYAFLDGAAR
jgi:hypothetical protein